MAKYDEKELVVEYAQRKKSYEELKALCSDAFSKLEQTTQKIIEYMEDTGASSTAKYDGLGRLTLTKPQLYAKFEEESRTEVFDFLRENGMSDIIKETVHHSTLSSFIASLIKDGKPIPAFISTSYRKNVRFQQ